MNATYYGRAASRKAHTRSVVHVMSGDRPLCGPRLHGAYVPTIKGADCARCFVMTEAAKRHPNG